MYLVSRYLKAKSYSATTSSILLLKSRWRVYVWTKTNNEVALEGICMDQDKQ